MKRLDAKRVSPLAAGWAMAGALALVAATPGDVGGCGEVATELDAPRFAADKKSLDCRRCEACSFSTAPCLRACNDAFGPDFALPDTCRPLAHDGVVCLRALDAASCDDYRRYVDEKSPTLPSECEFCRFGSAP